MINSQRRKSRDQLRPRERAVTEGQDSLGGGGWRGEVTNRRVAERIFHLGSVFLEVGCVEVGDSRQALVGKRISLTKEHRELSSLCLLTTLIKSLQLKVNKWGTKWRQLTGCHQGKPLPFRGGTREVRRRDRTLPKILVMASGLAPWAPDFSAPDTVLFLWRSSEHTQGGTPKFHPAQQFNVTEMCSIVAETADRIRPEARYDQKIQTGTPLPSTDHWGDQRVAEIHTCR